MQVCQQTEEGSRLCSSQRLSEIPFAVVDGGAFKKREYFRDLVLHY